MHQRNENARLLTTAEVAERLGVSRSTVLNWCKAGYVQAVQYPSGQWRIPASEIERILTPIAPAAPLADSEDRVPLPGQAVLL